MEIPVVNPVPEEADASWHSTLGKPPAGLLEYVGWADEQVHVIGWCFLFDSPVIAFALRIGETEVQCVMPTNRPDVAAQFDHGDLSLRSGFEFKVAAPSLPRNSTIEITPIDLNRSSRSGLRLDFDPRALLFPLPPEHLARRVAQTASPWLWRFHGMKCLTDFRQAWQRHAKRADSYSVLDWGCGSGRLTPLLCLEAELSPVFGCDIDGEAIAWCRAHITDAAFAIVAAGDPLPYATGSMDLVVGYSVLTHLAPADQTQCLGELARVMKPGAVALLTVHGAMAWKMKHRAMLDVLEARGFVDFGPDPTLQGVAQGDYYREVFQSEKWTRAMLPPTLHLEAHYPGGVANFQDLLVLRRK